MVVAAYPLSKVGLLLLKQISKPVANFIKNEARNHPKIRKFLIVPTGKAFWWAEQRFLASVKGSKSDKKVTEEEALEIGSNALGEIILFGLLTLVLLLEYNRQSDKKAAIEKIKADEVLNIQDLILEISEDVEKLKTSVRSIELQLRTEPNIMDMDQISHVQDHNFLDILNNNKKIPEEEPNIET